MSDYESGLAAMILNCDFQKLQDEMASATKMACITVDYTGSPVTVHSGCTEFCSTVRKHPELGRLCEKCDSRGGLEAVRNKKPYMYVCHMGVVDVAIPIIYRNLYVGAVMCGQVVLPEDERSGDIERIISEQSPVGFSSSSRMLYDKLTVMPKSDIEANVSLINYLCNYRLSSVLSDADDGGVMPDDISFRRVNKNASIIQPAINYMRENYSSPVKLHTLAELCDVSASYFSKLFKKVTGENLVTYLNRLRVEHGKRELLSTNKSVQAISKESGFDDSGYFIKVFKAETGLTPNAFREKNSI